MRYELSGAGQSLSVGAEMIVRFGDLHRQTMMFVINETSGLFSDRDSSKNNTGEQRLTVMILVTY